MKNLLLRSGASAERRHPVLVPLAALLRDAATLTSWVVAVLFASLPAGQAGESPFRFAEQSKTSLALWEGDKPVFVYNHGVMSKEGVPADRNRSTYVHPLYGLDGEVLTDDFPKDHYHHRGLFWAWPHVKVGNQPYDLWMLKGIEQRFERWTARQTTATNAILGVENGWYVAGKKVMREQVWLYTSPATAGGRDIDVELIWKVGDEPITLQGAEGKSYGGLTLRFAPGTNVVITTPLGNTSRDLPITRLAWADLSEHLAGRTGASGAAIFISPEHPGYPPEWLTRHYGVLCVGWPGVNGKTFTPGETIRCRYRVWIHRGAPGGDALREKYQAYKLQRETRSR